MKKTSKRIFGARSKLVKIFLTEVLALILLLLIVVIEDKQYFQKTNAFTKKEKQTEEVSTSTPKATSKPTIIVRVKEKYKKGKLLQDHTVYHYSSYNRDINLKKAAKKINGTKIMPNKEFSFYGVIGEPTEEAGFVYAGGLAGGQSVTTIAGGICEVATSLNTVIVDAGIKTYGNFHHSANVGYLNETDHEVTVTFGLYDLKFTNTLKFPILIKQKAIGGNVRTRLYKMETIYVVTIKDVITGEKTVKQYSKKNIPKKYKLFIPEA